MQPLMARMLTAITTAVAMFSLFPAHAQTLPGPIVLYTDITSGPTTGGENNKGIYLSIFGKNFGTSGLGTAVKVFINDIEVDNYRLLTTSRGRPDIQQITVQVGTIGNPALRVALPIKVVAGGVSSNTDHNFAVNPGRIYFVKNATHPSGVPGDDTSGTGSFDAPFRTVQKPGGVGLSFFTTSAAVGGAWGLVRAGDFIVMRGGTYSDIGFASGNPVGEGYFLQTLNKSGCPLGVNCAQGGGTSSGPITVMGYPGETAFIDRTNTRGNNNSGGGITSADSARQQAGYGAWFTISNLKIESGFTDGPLNTQKGETNPLGGHWRVVNNELTAASCATSTLCRAGAIAGGGVGHFWVGNHGHDIYDQPDALTSLENHGVYIGGGGTFEIAYNVFENIVGGNGIQVQSFDTVVSSLRIHHNLIKNVGKHALNFTDGTGSGVVVWNNLIYDIDSAGVRFKDDNTRNLKLYNNTFYNVGRLRNTASGAALVNDTNAAVGMFDIRNNIFWANATAGYNSGCCNGNFSGGAATSSHNLWFGAGAAPGFDVNARTGNPNFISAGTNFRLATGSPAVDAGSAVVATVVNDDFDSATATTTRTTRPLGAAFDIGAFEGGSTVQCLLDLDGDGRVLAHTDGLMVTRLTRGQIGAPVVGGIVFPVDATRRNWTDIQSYLATSTLDMDGDGVASPTDALLLLRAMLGMTGEAVVRDLSFASGATRKTWADIRGYLVSQCGLTLSQ